MFGNIEMSMSSTCPGRITPMLPMESLCSSTPSSTHVSISILTYEGEIFLSGLFSTPPSVGNRNRAAKQKNGSAGERSRTQGLEEALLALDLEAEAQNIKKGFQAGQGRVAPLGQRVIEGLAVQPGLLREMLHAAIGAGHVP